MDRALKELVKFGGALALLAGVPLLFLFPPIGLLLVLVAAIAGTLSVTWTRRERHAELLAATGTRQPGPAAETPRRRPSQEGLDRGTLEERLAHLDRLQAAGLLQEGEYDRLRAEILGGL